jgi:hypothetical protein
MCMYLHFEEQSLSILQRTRIEKSRILTSGDCTSWYTSRSRHWRLPALDTNFRKLIGPCIKPQQGHILHATYTIGRTNNLSVMNFGSRVHDGAGNKKLIHSTNNKLIWGIATLLSSVVSKHRGRRTNLANVWSAKKIWLMCEKLTKSLDQKFHNLSTL